MKSDQRSGTALTWSKLCGYCKGYPGYDACACPNGKARITAERVRSLRVIWLTGHGRLLAHFAALDKDDSLGGTNDEPAVVACRECRRPPGRTVDGVTVWEDI